jgi:pyruvate/2-oxoglutarate/acetoin dehydrogenase E1 component
MTSVLQSLNQALHHCMQADERVYLVGEDLLDPYGGAFKVTRGLSEAFPRRVLTSPISEAGIVGLAGGMALRGLRPLVEIMFGDFLTLAADQIINNLSKFNWMYNGQVDVPVVIRTPMGGRRGYGPTHSQTLEKHFIGAPGLRVLAPCAFGDPGQLLADAILQDDQLVLFIENKLLYLQTVNDSQALADFTLSEFLTPESYAPTYTLTLREAPPPTLTLLAYGYMAGLARQAAQRLAYEHELFCEVVIPTQLSPISAALAAPLAASLDHTRRLLTVEEGTYTMGWGAEMLARAQESLRTDLVKGGRVAAQDTPIPASMPLEDRMLPQVETIMQTALKMV